jgi:hypothetical protein
MNEYYIDFSGYCTIEAPSEEEAREKFWDLVATIKQLPNRIFEIDGVEKKEV